MIAFEMHEDLDEGTIDSLRRQDVDVDDWGYMLFVPNKFKNQFDRIVETDPRVLEPISYDVDHLLHGCCANTWYSVSDFQGKKGILGVAYHA